MKSRHIHPIQDKMVTRSIRESILDQRGGVYWMTGLSGSGKSTIAVGLEKELLARSYHAIILDGDNMRSGLNSDLTFNSTDRKENIRRVAEVAKLFCQTGYITIASFISPTIEMRNFAKEIIGEDDFYEVYVNTPLEICEQRDVKGLYKKARAGEIPNFTGIDSPYEAPTTPYLEIKTASRTIEESVQIVLSNIIENSKIAEHEL